MEKIAQILGYKTWSNKRKVDALLEIDCTLYTNLGTDSTKTEVQEAKRTSRKIYKAIKQIDWYLGSSLLFAMDKK